MNVLSVENLTYTWGDITLFRNITFGIQKGQKVALIARNGAGKTTLLNVLLGREQADAGKVTFNDNARVAMLEQNPYFDSGDTVIGQAMRRLPHDTDQQEALEFEVKVRQTLGMLHIHDLECPVKSLSGGEQKRVALAAILTENPDFLILDEPTNHLDLEIIEWLEDYLMRANITLLMVTHDRYFLTRVCDQILELEDKTIYQYSGGYQNYLEKRAQRIEAANANVDKARNLLRREQEWMDRQPQARATKAKYRIDAYYELRQRAAKRAQDRSLELRFQSARLGGKVVNAHNLHKGYGERVIVRDFSYKFAKGEKVAIVGDNGSGKTTLLNMLTGILPPDSGRIETGETVRVGYYRQEGIKVDDTKTVIEVIQDIAERVETGQGSMTPAQFLRHFLFPNETHRVRVESLSGGERKRLYLQTVLVSNPNFLVLDEPTNDLDILTLNCLEEYLGNYKGTLVMVSHDRFFVDKLADHIFVMKGDGEVKDFPGNYSEYIAYSKTEDKVGGKAGNKAIADGETEKRQGDAESAGRGERGRERKLTYAERREKERLDTEMPRLSERIAQIEAILSGAPNPDGKQATPEQITELSAEYAQAKESLDQMEMRWLELDEIG